MDSYIKQVRKIDNSRHLIPFATSAILFFLIFIFIWFFRGGSFRLYASLFFGIYSVTGQIWVSVLLIGVIQNLVFMPLRFIGAKLANRTRDFEEELEKVKSNEQYFVFKKEIKEGNIAVVFFIFNFIVNAIAFGSACRIFLIDFYIDPSKLKAMNLLYDFIPYPKYPLQGTTFKLPYFFVQDTIALKWSQIFLIWLGIFGIFTLFAFVWRFLKRFLWANKKVLFIRINYNHFLKYISGFSFFAFLISLYILRNIPSQIGSAIFSADLTRQNTTMNFVTAVGTFLTTVHAGYFSNRKAIIAAQKKNIPQNIIESVTRKNMGVSIKNAFILGLGAFFITNQIPSAFELSVATFEFMYIIYPYTFDKMLHIKVQNND